MISSEVRHSAAFLYYLGLRKEILCKYEKNHYVTCIHSNVKCCVYGLTLILLMWRTG
jgi:hypothetical protein